MKDGICKKKVPIKNDTLVPPEQYTKTLVQTEKHKAHHSKQYRTTIVQNYCSEQNNDKKVWFSQLIILKLTLMIKKVGVSARLAFLANLRREAAKETQRDQQLCAFQQNKRQRQTHLREMVSQVLNKMPRQSFFQQQVKQVDQKQNQSHESTHEFQPNVLFIDLPGEAVKEGTFEGVQQRKVFTGHTISSWLKEQRKIQDKSPNLKRQKISEAEQSCLETNRQKKRDQTEDKLIQKYDNEKKRDKKGREKEASELSTDQQTLFTDQQILFTDQQILFTDQQRNVKFFDSEWLTFCENKTEEGPWFLDSPCPCLEKCSLETTGTDKRILQEITCLTNTNNFFENTWENRIRLYQHITKCSWQAQCYAKVAFNEVKNFQELQKESVKEKERLHLANLKTTKRAKGWHKKGKKGPRVVNEAFVSKFLKQPHKNQTFENFQAECIDFFWETPVTLISHYNMPENNYLFQNNVYRYLNVILQDKITYKRLDNLKKDLRQITGKRLRDQTNRLHKKMMTFQLSREFPFVYDSLKGLVVTTTLYNTISVKWKIKTHKKDCIADIPTDFNQQLNQLGWFQEQIEDLLKLRKKYTENDLDKIEAKDFEKIEFQAKLGTKNFERAMYHLRCFLTQDTNVKTVKKFQCKLNEEQVASFNRLSYELGFSPILKKFRAKTAKATNESIQNQS